MFDVGDLPVLTFGNWVLKAEWLSGLWNYMYVFFTFFVRFFQNPKKHDFLRFFDLLHTFSRTVAKTRRATRKAHTFTNSSTSTSYICDTADTSARLRSDSTAIIDVIAEIRPVDGSVRCITERIHIRNDWWTHISPSDSVLPICEFQVGLAQSQNKSNLAFQ